MLKQIIVNELTSLLGHKPSAAELKSAMEYFTDRFDEKMCIVNANVIFNDWVHDRCCKCESCGEYFLIDEMDLLERGWSCSNFECRNKLWGRSDDTL